MILRISEPPWGRHVCHHDRVGLEKLERQLLSQHDVADWEVTLGCEAQHLLASTVFVESLDIQRSAMSDAIARPALTSNDVKISMPCQLLTLGWSEIATEQPQALSLCTGIGYAQVACQA